MDREILNNKMEELVDSFNGISTSWHLEDVGSEVADIKNSLKKIIVFLLEEKDFEVDATEGIRFFEKYKEEEDLISEEE